MIQISKYNKQHPLRVFEAFAGYGSQSLAFKYLKEKHPEFDFKVVGILVVLIIFICRQQDILTQLSDLKE